MYILSGIPLGTEIYDKQTKKPVRVVGYGTGKFTYFLENGDRASKTGTSKLLGTSEIRYSPLEPQQ